MVVGWIGRQRATVLECLKPENWMLRERLKGRSLRFSDRESILLERKTFGIPPSALPELGMIVTPDTELVLRPAAGSPQ
jgi:hypothetical protein